MPLAEARMGMLKWDLKPAEWALGKFPGNEKENQQARTEHIFLSVPRPKQGRQKREAQL